MYNPQIKYACDMVKEIHDRHAAELAYVELVWERITNGLLDNGEPKIIQVVPTILSQFKG